MNTTKSINKRFYGVKKLMDSTSTAFSIFRIRTLAIAITCFSSASFATQGVDFIPPAQYQTMDKYQVNVAGGQVSPTIETVAIGGALGLKHSITAMGNYFDLSHSNNGYQDKYAGGLKFTQLGTNKSPNGYPDLPAGGGSATVMRASFLGQHADFIVIKDSDSTYQWGYYGGTDYHYETVGDKRHTLERTPDGLVWTQPDGTQVFLSTTDMTHSASAHTDFAVEKVVYPNGFTIEVPISGVITNTGFALKYEFDSADPGLDTEKQNPYPAIPYDSNAPTLSANANANASASVSFRAANPKYVRAINTAIESCNLASGSCKSNNWPKATFTWPGGTPRAMFIGKSTFSVTNAAGGRTDLIYEAQDAGIPVSPSIPRNTPWKLIAPRLVEIKSAGATASTAVYTYKNQNPTITTQQSAPGQSDIPYYDLYLCPGILSSATGVLGAQNYNTSPLGSGMPGGPPIVYGQQYLSGSDLIVEQYTTGSVGTFIKIVDTRGDRTIFFEPGYRNFVTQEKFGMAPQKDYLYDDRGNLAYIKQGTVTVQAGYPATCTNRKTCNKPMWVIDPNGKTTDYTYHSESGQIQTVTSPADNRGVRAQTRYEYEQFYAYYFNAQGVLRDTTKVKAIWLKTAEKSCTNSNYSGSLSGGKFVGSCGAGDQEVVTRYEYKSKNRLMTAQVVEADGKKYRTCFEYDIYGNQIGKTEPKAGLAACPQEWSEM